jgi:soluble lytic murein transglycosylase-like protein
MAHNRINKNRIFLMSSLAALFAALHVHSMSGAGATPKSEILKLAETVISKYGFNVDPKMVVAMIQIESAGNPAAVRYEPHLRDVSVGLMQTLGGTARWLAEEMGYNAYGVPSNQDLINPEISIYFGAAYIHWLSTYKGQNRGVKWIVESYNGGPGQSNSQTRNHWNKYKAARMKV